MLLKIFCSSKKNTKFLLIEATPSELPQKSYLHIAYTVTNVILKLLMKITFQMLMFCKDTVLCLTFVVFAFLYIVLCHFSIQK